MTYYGMGTYVCPACGSPHDGPSEKNDYEERIHLCMDCRVQYIPYQARLEARLDIRDMAKYRELLIAIRNKVHPFPKIQVNEVDQSDMTLEDLLAFE